MYTFSTQNNAAYIIVNYVKETAQICKMKSPFPITIRKGDFPYKDYV